MNDYDEGGLRNRIAFDERRIKIRSGAESLSTLEGG